MRRRPRSAPTVCLPGKRRSDSGGGGLSRQAVCWHTMKRTTVKLPDELDSRLRHEAARTGKTVSELTREAIEAYVGLSQRRTFLSAGAGKSGRSDISDRIEEILQRETERSD